MNNRECHITRGSGESLVTIDCKCTGPDTWTCARSCDDQREEHRSYELQCALAEVSCLRNNVQIVADQRNEAREELGKARGHVQTLRDRLGAVEAKASSVVELRKSLEDVQRDKDRWIERTCDLESRLVEAKKEGESTNAHLQMCLDALTCLLSRHGDGSPYQADIKRAIAGPVDPRGVAGDRCENGNECGRTGCPQCQA